MRSPSVSGNADEVSAGLRSEVSAGLRSEVSAPMRRTMSAVPRNRWLYEEGADLFLAGVLFAAGRRVGLGAMS